MNVVHSLFPPPEAGVAAVDQAADLSVFCAPSSAATIWRRSYPGAVRTWLDCVPEARLPRGRVILRPAALRRTLAEFFALYDTPSSVERQWLIDDMTDVAETFAGLMDAAHVRLRLDVVTTNACRKFHVDAIHSRLVCTYRGTGTQFGQATPGGDPARVFTVATGDPILLRGTLWRETPPAGLLHRSPPIEGTGETRLVLVIDPIFDPEEAA